ncbi:MAG: hypothetical protein B6D58_07575 [candidate division Zixibacteria bacterium 4484_95]|nr:MAG: hypothetical protein B6D58_07575 [candidate division Zixibacteria bacterium 4484_95]
MGKIKVLQLVEDFGGMGGAERVVYDLVNNLNPDEFDLTVAIVGERGLATYFDRTNAKIYYLPGSRHISLKILMSLIGIIKSNNIDITHSHLVRMNTYNWFASRWCRVPNVGSIHGIMQDEVSFRARLYSRWAAKFSTRIVTVSEKLRLNYIDTYGVNPAKVITIYNGFDVSRVEKNPDPQIIKEFYSRYNCSPCDPIIVAIGHIREVKGYAYLIKAVFKVKVVFPNIHLFIAGDDAAKEKLGLVEEIEKMNLHSNITFLGFYKEITTLFEIADIYVSSSLHEGFSLTTVEAMAYGLPVVVTDCGGPAEIVENGKCGLITPKADSEELARSIIKLLCDKRLREQYGENGKKRAYSNFSMNNFIEKHENLYRKLIMG